MRPILLSLDDVATLNRLTPFCARCNKPVDFMNWRRSLSKPVMSFRVECHGAVEETRIDIAKVRDLIRNGVSGQAFAEPEQLR